MDTLFRSPLVSFQQQQAVGSDQQSFNSTSRSSSKQNINNNPNYYYQQSDHQEECFFNSFMDDNDDQDFSSSSSSRHYNPYYYQHQQSLSSNTPTTTQATTTSNTTYDHNYQQQQYSSEHIYQPPPDINMEFSNLLSTPNSKWASEILSETARAIADGNSSRVQQLMWMLNELSSPYGDIDQKLASYFLQALFSRMTDSGERTYQTLTDAAERTCSFETTRKTVLKFQEVSPWTTFGHVACNGAILEALEGEPKIHIIDVSNTYCTQWPTLLEAIATRSDEAPHLKLTTVVSGKRSAGSGSGAAAVQRVMKEIGQRMERFARLMGVPFKFNVIHHDGDLSGLDLSELNLEEDEALAVNCVGALHAVTAVGNRRDYLVSVFRRLNPRIVTIVEEEADFNVGADGSEFVRGFRECLRWYRVYFEALDECFPKTSNERLMLERAAAREVVDLVGCPEESSVERRETAARWSHRLRSGGFGPVSFNEEVCDDVRALLRRYKEGWSMVAQGDDTAGIFLCWKEQPVVWASAWKPS